MNEYTLQFISFSKLIWIAIFSYLYGLGGIRYKVLRRFIGAGWMILGVIGFQHWQGNINYWALLWPVLLCAGLHKGYGGQELAVKMCKRALYGLLLGLAATPLALVSGMWALYGYSIVSTVIASVVFGAFNPFKNARDEESNVAVAAVIFPMFMV